MSAAFPDSFLWGTASAGHQIEGSDDHADTTFMEHIAHTVFSEPAGKANDSWNRWREDLDLVQGMGLNAYRFSVEWSRIEPEQGVVDQSALDRYSQMIDGCLERGITPVVTLCHFTAPSGSPAGAPGSTPTPPPGSPTNAPAWPARSGTGSARSSRSTSPICRRSSRGAAVTSTTASGHAGGSGAGHRIRLLPARQHRAEGGPARHDRGVCQGAPRGGRGRARRMRHGGARGIVAVGHRRLRRGRRRRGRGRAQARRMLRGVARCGGRRRLHRHPELRAVRV
ncbi:glycoside hydrolase family 1 protein [Bifidobacterium pullorum subsp. saeculare]|uniref:Glycoside hydrolase family 1 protein n=1 Tax=Bifidobacterium pullorum subsp. saeculare TaxID=78257 RepID=A0A938WWJ3_9BIFI|nr:glycoside hydrolase family 1 protein [Bifidobacterium pullorum subsp. saeculare]